MKPVADLDARGKVATATDEAAVAARVTPAQRKDLEDLKRGVKDLTVRWSTLTGAPSRIHSLTQALTGPSGASPRGIATSFLARYRNLFNLSSQDLAETRFSREYTTRHNGVTHLTLQQQQEGVDVFGGLIQINIDREGRILNVASEPVPRLRDAVNTRRPTVQEKAAIDLAAAAAGVSAPKASRSSGLIFFPMAPGKVRLAWDVTVEDSRSPNIYRSLVDATDGALLWRQNQTYYSHVDAHGPVYTGDSPNPNTPTGTSVGTVARVDSPFNGLALFPHADPHADWWSGSGEAARNLTRSNNVRAHHDRDNDNDDSEGYPPAVAGEDFTFPIDLTMDPVNYTSAATVNLFHRVNVLHDSFYRLGFDEASGNFQISNFGLGGAGGDPVQADAQDDAADPDGARCNANMGTPGDGASPRMQMYVCGIQDGDLDNEVISHEYTHGVHSRLVPTLSGSQGGMSEGWADFFAISFLSQTSDDLNGTWRIGRWLFFPGGIRRQPYTTNQTIFTRTYADIVDGSFCTVAVCSNDPTIPCNEDADCGAGNQCQSRGCSFDFQCQPPVTTIPQGICVAEVHNTGELWAETLWLARSNLVRKYGFATGGQTINQLVIDGMKLAAPAPDFLDMRNAILSADLANNGGVNQCLLWDAFANMGLGASALTTGPTDINPVEAFDTPSSCTPNVRVSGPTDLGDVCPGSSQSKQLEVFNIGTGDLIVYNVSRTSGSADITVDPQPTTPVFISPDAHVDFNIRCGPSSFGNKSANIRVETNDPDQPTINLNYVCRAPSPAIATLVADAGSFGDVCLGSFRDLALTISNGGGCNLSVTGIASSSPAEFQVAGVAAFPLTIGPGASLQVPIRFQPLSLGPKAATFTISSNDPSDPFRVVGVTGVAPPGDVRLNGTADFGDVCAGTRADTRISVCNVGKCDLHVLDAHFDPACPDFMLLTRWFPATVSHDFCMDLIVRFTPTSAGPKVCRLVVVTDDPDTPISGVVITANTPIPSIDVPPDLGFPPTAIQSTGACYSNRPFPVSNKGTCNLSISNIAITDDPAEFSVSAVPSFPIILLPGHVAGEGALEAGFSPAIIDRDRTGVLTVTYVSDPITGATTSVARALCGEGVRTGARVLVREPVGGVLTPMAFVEAIHIQRVVGNRNQDLLDTVDVAMNLPLQTVLPAPPCAPFQYHMEYGTVSNPIQLLPGNYKVTATTIVGGKRMKKSIGFSVTTCEFNPTIMIDMVAP
jgi:extracellular elastinolytic metalloproteinase